MEEIYIAPPHDLDDQTLSDSVYLLNYCVDKRFELEDEKRREYQKRQLEEPDLPAPEFQPHFDFIEILSTLSTMELKLRSLGLLISESLGEDDKLDEKFNIAEESIRLSEIVKALDSYKDMGLELYLNLVSFMVKLKNDEYLTLVCSQAEKLLKNAEDQSDSEEQLENEDV